MASYGDLTPLSGLPLQVFHIGPPDWDITVDPQTSIVDFSPLGWVTRLFELRVVSADLHAIAFVAELTSLRTLDVRHNAIADLSPLRGLDQLTSLQVDFNRVEDLSPLAEIETLEDFSASNNPIVDLTPLSNHPSIQTLMLFWTGVRDVSPCYSMPALGAAYFCFSPVTDPNADPAALDGLRARGVTVPGADACPSG